MKIFLNFVLFSLNTTFKRPLFQCDFRSKDTLTYPAYAGSENGEGKHFKTLFFVSMIFLINLHHALYKLIISLLIFSTLAPFSFLTNAVTDIVNFPSLTNTFEDKTSG